MNTIFNLYELHGRKKVIVCHFTEEAVSILFMSQRFCYETPNQRDHKQTYQSIAIK